MISKIIHSNWIVLDGLWTKIQEKITKVIDPVGSQIKLPRNKNYKITIIITVIINVKGWNVKNKTIQL